MARVIIQGPNDGIYHTKSMEYFFDLMFVLLLVYSANLFLKIHIFCLPPVPYLSIQEKKYEMYFGEQNSSVVIVRQGVDVSGLCTVWCGSRLLPSDKSGEINSYYQITFHLFQTSAVSIHIFLSCVLCFAFCVLTINIFKF